ncbi:hypothetical protein C2869_03245 [Saccharobesus litoralis]|uniref:Polyketide cyclase / dehydrase and lipid transport n=1 Tax=Saccharobesus litoralis TaxID=2172099 RepID=A0A2S0VMR7_9ALTE|nr:SRPBCC family protein [Saccharobesus litoralis]AWB65508.1 hypothetical protein C2869_03245 [Saccharobesus litoralis]
MSKIRIAVYAIYVFVGLIVGFSFILPNNYSVYRGVIVDAQPNEIHEYVGNLDNWSDWTLWQQQDPSLKIAVLKPTGVGANQRWGGDSGTGSLTFIREDTWYGVDYDLIVDNNPPMRASILYSLDGNMTRVEWFMRGKVNIPIAGPYMALMMDGMLGSMLQDNLDNLKRVVESAN